MQTQGSQNIPANAGALNYDQGNGRFTLFDGSVHRAILGFEDDGAVAFKVSPAGVDVFTAADNELIFNSSQNVFKIVETGNIALNSVSLNTGGASWSASTGSNLKTIPHNLGYNPALLAYWDTGNGYTSLPYTRNIVAAGSSFMMYSILCFVDAQNIYASTELVGYNVNQSFGAINIKYYLLQETAS